MPFQSGLRAAAMPARRKTPMRATLPHWSRSRDPGWRSLGIGHPAYPRLV